MSTQSANLTALAQAIGTDVKSLKDGQGVLSSLTTTAKSSLVAAINELVSSVSSSSSINDSTTGTTTTWSSSKITTQIAAIIDDTSSSSTTTAYSASKVNSAISDAINALIDGAPSTYDTLKEISDYIASDTTGMAALTTAINNRVRYDDTQTLTALQQLQACNNIGIGDPTTDLVSEYEAARDAT